MPFPTGLVVKNGSKIRRRVASLIPSPVSRTSKLDVAPRLEPVARRVDPHRRGLDDERASGGHRVARVHHQVHQHLLELPAIGAHPGQAGAEPGLEGDVLANHPPEHPLGVADQPVEVEHLELRPPRGG